MRNESGGRNQTGLRWQVEGRLRRNVAWPVDGGCLADFVGLIISLFEGLRGRRFSSERNDVLSADDDKSESALDLFLHSSFVGLGDSVLFRICEDDVHVLIEGEEGADHHASILNSNPHSEVDPLQEFAALGGHLLPNL